jgi:hypothetical protein
LNGAVIQLLTLLLQLLVYSLDEPAPVNGAMGIWFCLLYKYCHYNSQAQIKFCCFKWKFRRGTYPFILLAVCILLAFGVKLEAVVGLAYGMLQCLLERITPFPSGLVGKLGRLFSLSSVHCWVLHAQTDDPSDQAAFTQLDLYEGSSLVPKGSPESSTVSDPFSHKQGIRLGDY